MKNSLYVLLIILLYSFDSAAQVPDTLGIRLNNYEYPYPVHFMQDSVQNTPIEIAYMDVPPEQGNGKTVLLFHGKNFPAAYWRETIRALADEGYRVIIPDALGFGKSSKPVIQYSFSLLATLDKKLLDKLGVKQVAVIGHSMGGMLATRFALTYPERVRCLVLEDAIGLEDWRSKGVPYRKADEWYADEMKATYESILSYHKTSYYPEWKEKYQEWVLLQYGVTKSKQHN